MKQTRLHRAANVLDDLDVFFKILKLTCIIVTYYSHLQNYELSIRASYSLFERYALFVPIQLRQVEHFPGKARISLV